MIFICAWQVANRVRSHEACRPCDNSAEAQAAGLSRAEDMAQLSDSQPRRRHWSWWWCRRVIDSDRRGEGCSGGSPWFSTAGVDHHPTKGLVFVSAGSGNRAVLKVRDQENIS